MFAFQGYERATPRNRLQARVRSYIRLGPATCIMLYVHIYILLYQLPDNYHDIPARVFAEAPFQAAIAEV